MATLWILGEAKSGKSELAEEIFARLPGRKLYIGTLPRTPENMETIRKHAERRPPEWALVEITDSLVPAIEWLRNAEQQTAVLLDGWGVYASTRARQWPLKAAVPSPAELEEFAHQVLQEYKQLQEAAEFLVVVAHVAARYPSDKEIAADPRRALVRAATVRCMSLADEVIRHDEVNVTHEDAAFVSEMARRLLAAA